MMGVDNVNACNAYTKAGNPYNKTNKCKIVGTAVGGGIAGTSYLAGMALMKRADKGAKLGVTLASLPVALKLLAIGFGIGAIVDFVKN